MYKVVISKLPANDVEIEIIQEMNNFIEKVLEFVNFNIEDKTDVKQFKKLLFKDDKFEIYKLKLLYNFIDCLKFDIKNYEKYLKKIRLFRKKINKINYSYLFNINKKKTKNKNKNNFSDYLESINFTEIGSNNIFDCIIKTNVIKDNSVTFETYSSNYGSLSLVNDITEIPQLDELIYNVLSREDYFNKFLHNLDLIILSCEYLIRLCHITKCLFDGSKLDKIDKNARNFKKPKILYDNTKKYEKINNIKFKEHYLIDDIKYLCSIKFIEFCNDKKHYLQNT